MKNENPSFENKLVYFIAFFSNAGYYAGLALFLSFWSAENSRYFTVPIRLVLFLVMLYLIKKRYNNLSKNYYRDLFILFIFFWIFYFAKVLICEYYFNLNMNWIYYIMYSLSYVILPFFMFASIPFEKYKKTILDAFISSGFVMGITCSYLYQSILSDKLGRISSIQYENPDFEYLSPLALSYSGALTMTLCIHKLIYSSSIKEKIYLISTIVVSFIMFLLGASRGSVIVLVLCLLFISLYNRANQSFKLIALGIIFTPIVIWGVQESGSSVFERTFSIQEDIAEKNTSAARLHLWQDALDEFINNPVFGGRIEVGEIYPHNFIIEILMATGAIGFFLIFPILISGIFLCHKLVIKKTENIWVLFMLMQGIVFSLLSGALYFAIMLFLSLGIIYSAYTSNSFKQNST